MKREDMAVRRMQLTRDAKRQALGILDAIAKGYEPTQSLLERVDTAYRSNAQYLQGTDEFRHLLDEIHSQGSRAIGTLLRPIADVGVDIDLVARLLNPALLRYSGYGAQERLLDDLYEVQKRYGDRHGLRVERRTRCVTMYYENDFHADITPVIDAPLRGALYGDTHGLVPDRDLAAYLGTNPRGYQRWFNAIAKLRPVFTAQLSEWFVEARKADIVPLPPAQEVFDRLLCRMAQVAKIHRNYFFRDAPGDAPTSIFITTLIARLYEVHSQRQYADELEMFIAVIENMLTAFNVEQHPDGTVSWILMNPTTINENLACRMNTPVRQKAFMHWHVAFVNDLYRLAEHIDQTQGRDMLLRHVEGAFGPKGAGSLRSEMVEHTNTHRLLGNSVALGALSASGMARSYPHNFHGSH